MSEVKPKRGARDAAQIEAALTEAVAAATAPAIERNTVPEPEPVSATALAQAAPAGPACPVPATPESSPSEEAPEAARNAVEASAAAENAWTAFAEAQSALARGFERAAVEVTGISRSGVAATADAAVALLGARTFAEALEINAGLARRGVDSMLEGSARLSEIGATAMTEAAKPIFSRLGGSWSAPGGN